MPYADLHMHTHYSDGWATPEELVNEVAARGLEVFSVTDHNSQRAYPELVPLAAEAGLELIAGVELSTHWAVGDWSGRVDVLAYGMDLDDAEFGVFLTECQTEAEQRTVIACERLNAMGVPITMDDVRATNPRYPAVGTVVWALEDRGFTDSFKESARLFRAAWAETPPSSLSTQDAIRRVHEAGGVTSLAHPVRIKRWADGLLSADDLAPLVEAGLDFIEVYHHSLNEEARTHYHTVAETLGLPITGGSDEHKRTGFTRLAAQPVTRERVEVLKAHIAKRQAAQRTA